MPVPPIAPFETFERPEFHVGGNPDQVEETARTWQALADEFDATAENLSRTDLSSFIGREGERLKVAVNGDLVDQALMLGILHGSVAEDLYTYYDALTDALAKMWELTEAEARPDHARLQSAISDYNLTEQQWIQAELHANQLAAAAVGAPALMPAAIAARKAAALAAQRFAAAKQFYVDMLSKWGEDLKSAKNIKRALGVEVNLLEKRIKGYSKASIKSAIFNQKLRGVLTGNSPEYWRDANSEDHVDNLYGIADHPLFIGSGLGFAGGIGGLILHGIEVVKGEATPESFLQEVPRALKVKLGRGATKAGKGLVKGSLNAIRNSRDSQYLGDLLDKDPGVVGHASRGDVVISALEPVDMATGSWLDSSVDVSIDGVLPLVVRRMTSEFGLSHGVFGTRWVSNLDCRIEVYNNKVVMLAPDGAVITFPMPTAEKIEVKGVGRHWTLMFAEGAYHIRDVVAGLTYVFGGKLRTDHADMTVFSGAALSLDALRSAGLPLGVPESSVAAAFDGPIVVGLTTLYSRSGHWIEYRHNVDTGLLDCIRRSDGTMLRLSWDHAVSHLAGVTVVHEDFQDVEELLISYSYDGRGLLREVRNSAPGALRYLYDDDRRVVGWTDRNGVTYKNVVDSVGRVIAQAGTGGVYANACVWLADDAADAPEGGRLCVAIETAAVFDQGADRPIDKTLKRLLSLPIVEALNSGGLKAAGLIGQGRDGQRSDKHWQVPKDWLVDDMLGEIRPTVYRSTASGDVWRVVKPSGACTDRYYDSFHRVIREIGPSGAETSWTYDVHGFVDKVVKSDGTITTTIRDEFGRPVEMIDQSGNVTHFSADEFGMINHSRCSDGDEVFFEYEYRSNGVVQTAKIDESGTRIEYERDKAGRLLAIKDELGTVESVVRDHAGRVVKRRFRNEAEQVIEYSPEGWPWRVTGSDGSVKRLGYDGEGNVLQMVDPDNNIATCEYMVFDKPYRRTNFAGESVEFVYNTQLELIGIINAAGQRWDLYRDADGDLIAQRDYNGVVTWFNSDAVGGVEISVDALGNESTIRSDGFGRILEERWDGYSAQWDYLQNGSLAAISSTDANIQFLYDTTGKYAGEELLAHSATTGVYQWRDGGSHNHHLQIALPGGTMFNQVVRVAQGRNDFEVDIDFEGLQETIVLRADGAGRRTEIAMGGVIRQFGYTDSSRRALDYVFERTTQQPLARRQWRWDLSHRLVGLRDIRQGDFKVQISPAGQLQQVVPEADTDARLGEYYEYSFGRPLTVQSERHRQLAEAGVARSRASVERPAQPQSVELSGARVESVADAEYSYDELGRVVQIMSRKTSHSTIVKKFAYRGSTGQVSHFESSEQPDHLWRYEYDGLGRRCAKICESRRYQKVIYKKLFTYLGDEPVAETVVYDSMTSPKRRRNPELSYGTVWVRDPQSREVLLQLEFNQRGGHHVRGASPTVDVRATVVVCDLAGAPRELIDLGTAEVVGVAEQNAYGLRQWTGQPMPLLFAGQYEDAESGWVYNRNRYYDPRIMSYTAPDPAGVAPNVNSPYSYVSNPLVQTDPLGLKICDDLGRDLQDERHLSDKERQQYDMIRGRLNVLRDQVVDEWNQGQIELSPAQREHVRATVDQEQQWALPKHRGTAMDMRLKDLVGEDDVLQEFIEDEGLSITPQGAGGADFEIRDDKGVRQMWWDLTTERSAGAHMRKYGRVGGLAPGDHIIGYQDAGVGEYNGMSNPLVDGHDMRGFVESVDLPTRAEMDALANRSK